MDDLELLKQYALDGAEEAFGTLVSRHIDMVYSVALRQVGNPDSAKEIAQAVFIILAGKSRQLCAGVVLAAWLYQTTRLTASHWLRTERRRARREQEVYMQSLSNEKTPDIWERVAPLLDDAIAGLGEKDRNAIVFRFFQGKNLAQVGAALGTSEDGAHKRVNRAVEKLRNFYVKRGIAVSAAALAASLTASSVHAAPAGLASAIAAAAALKGAMAAGPMLTLIKGTLNIMAWTKLKTGVFAGVALILAFGGGRIMATRGIDFKTAPPSNPVVNAQATTNAGNAKSSASPAFRWENIESADYRQYIANMRAAGIPESVIRDIVIGDLHKNFAARMRAVRGAKSHYWQNRRDQPTGEQMRKLNALMREESDVAQALFGQKLTYQKMIDELVIQDASGGLDSSVAWLPPDKRDAARRAFDAAGLADYSGSDAFSKRLAVLKGILTPAELEEYKLRESPAAESIRQSFYYADLTPDEFKVLTETALDANRPPGSLVQQSPALVKLVGEDRANEILSKSDSAYFWIRQAVDKYDLPIEAADQAYKLKTDTESAMMKIIDDPTLSKTQQERQFNALQASAKTAFINCLGTNGAKFAYSGDASWLFFDMKSYLLGKRPRP